MSENRNYQLGMLCLTHLLISADGVMDKSEVDAIRIIKDNEKISHDVFLEYQRLIADKKERDIFQCGVDLINQCTDEEKLKVLVTLYKLSEVDGRVHVKEIRLLLYSIKLAGVEFDDVVTKALRTPSLL